MLAHLEDFKPRCRCVVIQVGVMYSVGAVGVGEGVGSLKDVSTGCRAAVACSLLYLPENVDNDNRVRGLGNSPVQNFRGAPSAARFLTCTQNVPWRGPKPLHAVGVRRMRGELRG